MSQTASLAWHPIESLDARFRANLSALETRDPQFAQRLCGLTISRPFFISAQGNSVYLGRQGTNGIEVIADPVPPASARKLAAQVFPKGEITGPLAVGGLGYGWLWDCLSKLTSRVDILPGHRPPLYFLAGDIQQLWAVLHVMDWRAMLADARYPIFAGPDAIDQFTQTLIADPTLPELRGLIQIDSSLPRQDINSLLATVRGARDARIDEIYRQLDVVYNSARGADWAGRFRSGRLRILGITSRYTTFLQHSMRDWLAAFERMGHETRLAIERNDHLMMGAFGYASAILDFKPDLIVVIDHYRAEMGNIPKSIPCVMWVQDRLPNIYCEAAGAAQAPRDYCLGFSRLQLSGRYGYPAERFLSATIGINDRKYPSIPLTNAERDRFACDASYVSHASAPSQRVVEKMLGPTPRPEMARLVWDMHDRMVGHFESGGQVLTDPVLRLHLIAAIHETGFDPGLVGGRTLIDFFGTQVNNAIFRHQALKWVADAGVDLRIYGRGWESHPTLSSFARGEADNVHDLGKIYRGSKINLQVITHGAVHQRLLDGLVCGAFFLMRYTPGDDLGPPYRALWDFCRRRGIRSDEEMRAAFDDQGKEAIARIESLVGYDTSTIETKLYDCVATLADNDFASLATGVWPEQYPHVSFKSATDLHEKLASYLADEQLRQQIASDMGRVVVERFSYRSISERLLRLIGRSLDREDATPAAAIAA